MNAREVVQNKRDTIIVYHLRPSPIETEKRRDGKKRSERVFYPCVKQFRIVIVDKSASSLKAPPSKTPDKTDEKVNMTFTALASIIHNFCYFSLITMCLVIAWITS